ncbi:MAG: DUF4142 domain-containing protein, partial [Candidatus Acidiferrales bacterium]
TAPPPTPNTRSDTPTPDQPPETPSNQPMRRQPRANMAPMNDADFAKEAAQGGSAEIKLGQLAQETGSSDAVKNFGKRMAKDHSKADENLKSAAAQSNIDLPTGLSAKDQSTYDRLAKLSGTEFDQAYARDMVRDHIQDIAAFREESTTGKDPSIKAFATQTLPTLQDHLRDARAMAREVGVQPRHANGARAAASEPGSPAPPPQ